MIIAKPKNPSSASIVAPLRSPLCLTTPPLTPTKEVSTIVGQTSSSLSSNDSAFVEDLEEIQPLVQPLKTPHKDTPFLHNTKIIDITNMSSSRSKVSILLIQNVILTWFKSSSEIQIVIQTTFKVLFKGQTWFRIVLYWFKLGSNMVQTWFKVDSNLFCIDSNLIQTCFVMIQTWFKLDTNEFLPTLKLWFIQVFYLTQIWF